MKRCALFLVLVAFAGCRHRPSPELLREYASRSLVTCCNIHYETQEINDANYYVGSTLPLGTPALVQGVTDDSVTFLAAGHTLTLYHQYGKDQESMRQYLDKTLVADDPKVRVATYPRAVQDAIRDGRVERGMTREQVILSLGYPPTHRTPSTDASEWTYWYNHWVTYQVQFGPDGKVANVIGRPAPTQDQPIPAQEPTPAKAAPKTRAKKKH